MGNSSSGLFTAVQEGDLDKLKELTDTNGKLRDVNSTNDFGCERDGRKAQIVECRV